MAALPQEPVACEARLLWEAMNRMGGGLVDWYKCPTDLHRNALFRHLHPEGRLVWLTMLALTAKSPVWGRLYFAPLLWYRPSELAWEATTTTKRVATTLEILRQYKWISEDENGAIVITEWDRFAPTVDRPPITPTMRKAVFGRDGHRCRYCGAGLTEGREAHIDHVIPLSRGGKHAIDNMVVACAPCNRKKYDRTPEEMGMTLLPIRGEAGFDG